MTVILCYDTEVRTTKILPFGTTKPELSLRHIFEA